MRSRKDNFKLKNNIMSVENLIQSMKDSILSGF